MSWYRGLEDSVREQVSLSRLTSYGVGGSAAYYAEPTSEEALSCILRRTREEEIPVYFLGKGTNLLVSDRGVNGLVIKLGNAFSEYERNGNSIRVGAGHSLPGLVQKTLRQSLLGLECLVGVPGTLGAGLRMNAGGKYGEIGARVKSVGGMEFDGTPFEFERDECGFTYRDSLLKDRIVTRCEMTLDEGEPDRGLKQMRDILDEKKSTQPLQRRSAGCVFKNPKKNGLPPAGRMIDLLGLKGMRIGGAIVSEVHANFVVTEQGARASDVAALIRLIRLCVKKRWDVELETEIGVWGFEQYELFPEDRKIEVA